jgi:hypothetical protein
LAHLPFIVFHTKKNCVKSSDGKRIAIERAEREQLMRGRKEFG